MSENTKKKYLDYDGLSHFWGNAKNYINTLTNNAKGIINAGEFNTKESLINYPFEEGQLYQFCLSETLCSSTINYEYNEFLAVYLKDSDKFVFGKKYNGLLFIDLHSGISGQINLSEFDYSEHSLRQPIPFDLNYKNFQQLSRINGLKRGAIYRFRVDDGGDLWDQTFKAKNYCIGVVDEYNDANRYYFIDILSGKCGELGIGMYNELVYKEHTSNADLVTEVDNIKQQLNGLENLLSSI